MIRRRPALLVSAAAIGAALVVAAGAQAGPHSNAAAITINDSNSPPTLATAYPSPITVAAETQVINKATVTVTGINHNSTDDVDILFASPASKTVILMSDTGGLGATADKTYTFDSTAVNSLNDTTVANSGTYQPTNFGPSTCTGEVTPDTFPPSAPGGPYGSSLNSLINDPPNGVYNLYVVDDCFGDGGSITGGWTVTLTTGTPTAVALRSFVAYAHPHSVDLRWHTAAETGLLGFNVVRLEGNHAVRVNKALIRAKSAGSIADAAYRFVDRAVRPWSSYTYRLQEVRLDGSRVWLGTAGVHTAG